MIKYQKISVDAGFTCPNRDGKCGAGGCSFCANEAFTPRYLRDVSDIREQIEAGKRFYAGKYPQMRYVAYFQAYSNTYAPVNVLRQRYMEALGVDGVDSLIIGTRPDCLEPDVLDLLEEFKGSISVELGVESFYDKTLLRVNRGHDAACSCRAIESLAARGIPVGVHLIFGLPGESGEEILAEADLLSSLPVNSLKIHQLQIIKGTAMAAEYEAHPENFNMLSADEYARLVAEFAMRMRSDIKLERFAAQAPPGLVLAPSWGLKPADVQKLVENIRCK